MENNIEQIVQDRIAKGIKFNFDSFFADAWRIFKKVTLMIAGVTFLLAIPVLIIYGIMMPFLMGIESFDQYMRIIKHNPYYFQHMQRQPMFLLKQSLVSIIFAILFAPIQAGFLKMCRDADKTGQVNFGTAFYYYKSPFLGRILLSVLILTLVNSGLSVAFGFIPFIGSLMYLGVAICIYVFMAFVQPLIIFGNAELGQAFSLSMKIAGKAFFPILGFSLLFGLLCCLGVIACCIGIFFTIAFLPVANYLFYKNAIGFPEDEVEKVEEGNWQQTPPVV